MAARSDVAFGYKATSPDSAGQARPLLGQACSSRLHLSMLAGCYARAAMGRFASRICLDGRHHARADVPASRCRCRLEGPKLIAAIAFSLVGDGLLSAYGMSLAAQVHKIIRKGSTPRTYAGILSRSAARVVELVDAEDSKSSAARLVGSSPTSGTRYRLHGVSYRPIKPLKPATWRVFCCLIVPCCPMQSHWSTAALGAYLGAQGLCAPLTR